MVILSGSLKTLEKVIFLDFDGPISNPRSILCTGSETPFDPIAVGALSNLCEATGVKIVCSSTRTFASSQRSREETEALLTAAGFDLKHLHPDWSCFYDSGTSRRTHIKQWLAKHPEITHYAIIDDENVKLPNLVRVTERDGLLMRHFEQLARILDFPIIDIFKTARQKYHEANQNAALRLDIA
jgi:hypothetical protein